MRSFNLSSEPARDPIFPTTMIATPFPTEELHSRVNDALAISRVKRVIVTANISDGSPYSQNGNTEEKSPSSTHRYVSPELAEEAEEVESISSHVNIQTCQYEFFPEEDDICSNEGTPDDAKDCSQPEEQANTTVSTQAASTCDTYLRDNRSSTVSIDPRTMQQYANLGMPSSNVGSFRVNTELYPKWRECSQLYMDSESFHSDYIESSFHGFKNKGHECTSLPNKECSIVNDPNTGRFDSPLGIEGNSSNDTLMEPPKRKHQTSKQQGPQVAFDKSKRVESSREAPMTLEDSFSQLDLSMQRFEAHEQVKSPRPPIRAGSFHQDSISPRQVVEERPYHRIQSLPSPPTLFRPDYTSNDQSKPTIPVATKNLDQSRGSIDSHQLNSRQQSVELSSPRLSSKSTSRMHMRDSDRMESQAADDMDLLHAALTVHTTNQAVLETKEAPTPPPPQSDLSMQRFGAHEKVESPRPPIRSRSFQEDSINPRQVVEDRPYHRIQSLPSPPTVFRPDYTSNNQSQPTMPVATKNLDQSRGSIDSHQLNSRQQSVELSPRHDPHGSSKSTSRIHMRDSDRMESQAADDMDLLHAGPIVRTTNQAVLETEEVPTPPPPRPCPTCEFRESQRSLMDEQCRSQRNLMDEQRRSPPIMGPCMDPSASFDPRAYMEMNRSQSFYQMRRQMDPGMAVFYPDPSAYLDPRAMMGADGPGAHSRVHNERSHTDPRTTCPMATREGMSQSEPIINSSSPAADPRIMDPLLMGPRPPIDPRLMDPQLMGYPGFPPPPMGCGYPPFGYEMLHTDQRAAMAVREGMSLSEPIINPVDPRMMDPRLMDPSPPVDPRMIDPRFMGYPGFPPPPMAWGYPPYPYPRHDPYAYMSNMSSYPPPSMIHHSGTMAPTMPPAPLASTPPTMDPVRPMPTCGSNKVPTSLSIPERKKKKRWTLSGLLKRSSSVKFNNKSSSLVDAVEDSASTSLSDEKGAKSPTIRKKFFGRH